MLIIIITIALRCKLARGLLTGDYSKPSPLSPAGGSTPEGEKEGQKEQDGIRPSMFKTLIGTGHREFSSNRQQVIIIMNYDFIICCVCYSLSLSLSLCPSSLLGCSRIFSLSSFCYRQSRSEKGLIDNISNNTFISLSLCLSSSTAH